MREIFAKTITVSPNRMVRQHNDLIGAVFKLSLTELRMFYYCLAQIDLNEVLTHDKRFYIDLEGFSKLYNVEMHNARIQIKEGVDTWADRWFKLNKKDIKTNENVLSRWIVEKGEFINDKAMVSFSKNLIPLISDLKRAGNYTRSRIGNLAKLGTYYDYRFYNYAIEAYRKPSYDPLRERNFVLAPDEIRQMFKIENSYKKTNDLKHKILDPSLANISENTDIILKYTQIKKGRSIIAFDFHVIIKKEINNPEHENPYSKVVLTREAAKQLTNKPSSELFKDLQELGYLIDFGDGKGPVNYFLDDLRVNR